MDPHAHAMLTIAEAALELGIGESSLRKMINEGVGPRTMQNGNERLIPRWELRSWQERTLGAVDAKVEQMLTRPPGGPRIHTRTQGAVR